MLFEYCWSYMGKKKKYTGPGYLTLYENTDWRTREAKKNVCNDYLKD